MKMGNNRLPIVEMVLFDVFNPVDERFTRGGTSNVQYFCQGKGPANKSDEF